MSNEMIPKHVRILTFEHTGSGYIVTFPARPMFKIACRVLEFLDVTIIRLNPDGKGVAIARVPGNTLRLEYDPKEEKLVIAEIGLEQIHSKQVLRRKFAVSRKIMDIAESFRY